MVSHSQPEMFEETQTCVLTLRLLQGMNLDPNMMNMMKDLDGAEMNKQLETLGLSPSEVINKIMAEPDLAAAFQKPKVMQVGPPCPLLLGLIKLLDLA